MSCNYWAGETCSNVQNLLLLENFEEEKENMFRVCQFRSPNIHNQQIRAS